MMCLSEGLRLNGVLVFIVHQEPELRLRDNDLESNSTQARSWDTTQAGRRAAQRRPGTGQHIPGDGRLAQVKMQEYRRTQ